MNKLKFKKINYKQIDFSQQKNKNNIQSNISNPKINDKVEIKCINIQKDVKEIGSVKTTILKNINLEINKGEITIILGPSGSGKTTLLNVIAGIDKATSGNCFIKNVDINAISDKELVKFRRNYISYIYQRYGLISILSCYDNIRMGQNLVEKSKRILNIDEIIKIVDIEPLLEKFPHELSGGQRQRVAIARAIIKQPEIMLCDEPTGALDSETSRKIIDLFLEINKKFKTTIVMVTHEPSFVRIATKVIYIKDGEIEKIETVNRNNNLANAKNNFQTNPLTK
ncbi:MAG: ABC transporter ATP-binding protein [Malacoplasma sp.]|nr:ABC transporter ATP-binding protein [Malacoplasma sp.]